MFILIWIAFNFFLPTDWANIIQSSQLLCGHGGQLGPGVAHQVDPFTTCFHPTGHHLRRDWGIKLVEQASNIMSALDLQFD